MNAPNLFRDERGNVCVRSEKVAGKSQTWPVIDVSFSLFSDEEKTALVRACNAHEKAKAAIAAVLRRIQCDPRIAYYFDPITDSYEKLVAAHCQLCGLDEAQFRRDFESGLKFEAPADRD